MSKPALVGSVAHAGPGLAALLQAAAPDAPAADVSKHAKALAWRCLLYSAADEAARRSDKTKHPDRQARSVAKGCVLAFEGLTGRPAKVATRVDDGIAYGPFLDLVEKVFRELGLEARPEAFAREAARKPRP